MSDLLLLRYESRKVRNLEETVEDWQLLHADAIAALDAERLIREMLPLPNDYMALWRKTLRDAQQDAVSDLEATGLMIRGVMDRALAVLDLVAVIASRVARQTGHEIEGFDKLRPAREQMRATLDRFSETWPWKDRPWPAADRAALREARERMAHGQGERLADILARVRAGGPLVQE
jgi:hypothetical protein